MIVAKLRPMNLRLQLMKWFLLVQNNFFPLTEWIVEVKGLRVEGLVNYTHISVRDVGLKLNVVL
jgi:hypothetical protein